MKKVLITLFTLLLLQTPCVHADLISTITANVSGGTLTQAGGNSPVLGSMTISGAIGTDTPKNNGMSVAFTNSVFSIATGNLTSLGNFLGFDISAFSSGNFSVTGGLTQGATIISGNTTLLSGTLTGGLVFVNSATGIGELIASIQDRKNPKLAGFYGLDNPFTGDISLSFQTTGKDSHKANVMGGSIVNNALAAPEPTALMLFGCGAVGLLGLGRRRARA